MRRSAVVLVVLSALAIGACGGSSGSGGSGGSAPAAYNGKPVTITFWHPFTSPEIQVMNQLIANFEKLYPHIHVVSRGSISDSNIIAAIRSGSPPDLTMSNSAENLGE
jgi:multiple sugar transport system substrate-binding protein